MINIPRTIHEVHIFTRDNSAAVTPGNGAWLGADGDYLFNLEGYGVEDRQTLLEEFREALSSTFTGLWGQSPKVVFDFESGA